MHLGSEASEGSPRLVPMAFHHLPAHANVAPMPQWQMTWMGCPLHQIQNDGGAEHAPKGVRRMVVQGPASLKQEMAARYGDRR